MNRKLCLPAKLPHTIRQDLLGQFHELMNVPACGCDHGQCCAYDCAQPTTAVESVAVSGNTIEQIYSRIVELCGEELPTTPSMDGRSRHYGART